jgi:L-rhamnose mutarotase
MLRKAFIMGVNPDQHGEYERRHNPIWPELQQALKAHGVHNYSIFLDRETNQLFAYVEVDDEDRWDAIARTEVCQRWWKHMKAIMPSNPDNSPKSKSLEEVFHLD